MSSDKILKYKIVIVCLFVVANIINAQENQYSDNTILFNNVDQYYSADQDLVNGRRYLPSYPLAPGNPFLLDEEFQEGTIVINGKEFNNVMLNFDIVDHDVLLKYKYRNGAFEHIILNSSFIEEFSIQNKQFKRISINESKPKFYQFFSAERTEVLIYWEKKLALNQSSASYYKYSGAIKSSYLVIDNEVYKFRGNRSFISIFPPTIGKEIKLFLKKNNIDLKSAPDYKISKLLYKCDELISKNNAGA